ncbi:hypothetical protein GCM10022233_81350 [Streptomyces shaanxiensis]|uniref:Uncharacterized protein n=1 Tax=Streptomyces shaanxiensis TaxID=653357 RepID=A0ABP7WDG8_9ACTN
MAAVAAVDAGAPVIDPVRRSRLRRAVPIPHKGDFSTPTQAMSARPAFEDEAP